MSKKLGTSLVVPLLLCSSYGAYAAKAIDLSHQPLSKIQAMIKEPISSKRSLTAPGPGPQAGETSPEQLHEVKRNVDFNHTTHIRVKQTFDGFPVWGGEAVLHVPKAKTGLSMPEGAGLTSLAATPHADKTEMNGTVYEELGQDLQGAPKEIFTDAQAQKALQETEKLAQQYSDGKASEQSQKLMVYVDKDQKAHWAFLTSVYIAPSKTQLPAKPTFILDAQTLKPYKQWNDVQAAEKIVNGGGLGGNPNGRFLYDGQQGEGHLDALKVTRDGKKKLCFLKNELASVIDYRSADTLADVVSFSCAKQDKTHANLYWDGSPDSNNGGYSPSNDALYAGSVVQSLYKDWIGKPMLVEHDGSPMHLNLITHAGSEEGWDNAVWDSQKQIIFLGDGHDFYPLTSLGIIAHEVSHGFTQQHSGLIYEGQSGGMNESFSDMASAAAENYKYGKNTWMIGPEVMKSGTGALRYMEHPSTDCEAGHKPGDQCSIEKVSQYNERENVHYTSGIYNRAFYLMATAKNWDVKKAFQVMAQANANYWTSIANYQSGACGVVKATKDFGYDLTGVTSAFNAVGIDTSAC